MKKVKPDSCDLSINYEGVTCPFCKVERQFTSEWWLREHLKLNHTEEMIRKKKRG